MAIADTAPDVGADPREDTAGYRPPKDSEEHVWWLLATKFAIAMSLVALTCGWLGMDNPSTGIIASGFLVGSPPVKAVHVTAFRILGMFVGAALGVVGAYMGLANGNAVPALFFAGFGFVVGTIASFKSPLTYAGVIGAVVATTGATGDIPVPTVAWETSLQLLIGCLIGLAVIWIVEKVRAEWSARAS